MICKKEWQQFFSSLTGYLALLVYLLLNGLFLFLFPDTNLLDFGYASLAGYFSLAPWLLLFLIPTITMRSFADEFKLGSFEILKTLPLSPTALVMGKWLGSFLIVLTAVGLHQSWRIHKDNALKQIYNQMAKQFQLDQLIPPYE